MSALSLQLVSTTPGDQKSSHSSHCRFKYSIIVMLAYQMASSVAPHLGPAGVTLFCQKSSQCLGGTVGTHWESSLVSS